MFSFFNNPVSHVRVVDDVVDMIFNSVLKIENENARETLLKTRWRAIGPSFLLTILKAQNSNQTNHNNEIIMIQPLLYQNRQDFTFESVLFLTAIVVFTGLLLRRKWRRDLRETYPAYDKIPSTILTHMATRKALQELDKTVDIVVSCVLHLARTTTVL
jgi:hypothetical protein